MEKVSGRKGDIGMPERQTYRRSEKEEETDMTDLQAIRLSVKKWVVRVWRPLKKGKEVRRHTDSLYWADTHGKVPCYADTCPLCAKYLDICKWDWECRRDVWRGDGHFLSTCPLFTFQMSSCDLSASTAWFRFIKEPTVDNAWSMVQTLIDTYWWWKTVIGLNKPVDPDKNKEEENEC